MKTASPVLLLVYNRPEVTRQVFNAIRRVQPRHLFIAADGPNPSRGEDEALVAEVRSVVSQVDWPCEVSTLFRERNLGLKTAVGEAITWFFANVEEGIILEDDCLPNEDFFTFCDALLERHRDNREVAVITGNNFQNGLWRGTSTYYYSSYPHVWGWATWRRSWTNYDPLITFWPRFGTSSSFRRIFPESRAYRYWKQILNRVHSGDFSSTWAIPWTASIWRSGGVDGHTQRKSREQYRVRFALYSHQRREQWAKCHTHSQPDRNHPPFRSDSGHGS